MRIEHCFWLVWCVTGCVPLGTAGGTLPHKLCLIPAAAGPPPIELDQLLDPLMFVFSGRPGRDHQISPTGISRVGEQSFDLDPLDEVGKLIELPIGLRQQVPLPFADEVNQKCRLLQALTDLLVPV